MDENKQCEEKEELKNVDTNFSEFRKALKEDAEQQKKINMMRLRNMPKKHKVG